MKAKQELNFMQRLLLQKDHIPTDLMREFYKKMQVAPQVPVKLKKGIGPERAVSDYIDKLILDEYTLKYQMNIAMNGKYFLHDYDKDEVAHELEEFAGSILRLISSSMQKEIEYYYNSEELERLIVRRCNMLLLTYVQQKKQEKAGKTIIRG